MTKEEALRITKVPQETIDHLNEVCSLDYYDREGNKIGCGTWTALLNVDEYRRVAKSGGVSTIWLGLDHNFDGEEPHIFESYDGKQIIRYATEQEALAGHEILVYENNS